MITLFKRHPFASSAFLLASAVTLFFAIQMVSDAIYWADPKHRNQPPAEWMTPGYVAHSWKVDRDDLSDHLDFNRDGIKGRPSLKRIAESKGVPVQALIADLIPYLENSND